MNKPFVIIPARGGSKGIINKNLQIIFERVLIVRSIIHGQKLVNDDHIVISTDSLQIIKEITKVFKINEFKYSENSITNFGPFLLHFRGEELASDDSLITEVLFSIRNLLIEGGRLPGRFCLLQPTSPFRNVNELKIIKKIIDNNSDDNLSLVSVCLVEDSHPARMYELNKKNILEPLQAYSEYKSARRQDLPPVYIRDGAFYVMSEKLIAKKAQFSDQPKAFVREFPWSINIDSIGDLLTAQNINRATISFDPNEGVS
jgi:CMP-N,N'-diacetyllegionaminic acid synthase